VEPPERPLRVGVDAPVVERILSPLLENACRHGRRIAISVSADNGSVDFTVRDDGPGVPAGERERIFEPGVRRSGSGSGAGLGLPLARRLARSVGGEVDCLADDAPGAAFRVRLPSG
jgi:signal transduction histidine kinase